MRRALVLACAICAVNVVRSDDRVMWSAMLVLFLFDLVRPTETP